MENAREADRRGDDDAEKGVEQEVPHSRRPAVISEGYAEERLSKDVVDERDSAVNQARFPDVVPGHPQDLADKKVFDVLGAVGDFVDDEDDGRRRQRVDDPDNRFLGEEFLVPSREGEERGREKSAPERNEVRRARMVIESEEDGDRRSERRDLGEREIDENYSAREDVEAEVAPFFGPFVTLLLGDETLCVEGAGLAVSCRATSRFVERDVAR